MNSVYVRIKVSKASFEIYSKELFIEESPYPRLLKPPYLLNFGAKMWRCNGIQTIRTGVK